MPTNSPPWTPPVMTTRGPGREPLTRTRGISTVVSPRSTGITPRVLRPGSARSGPTVSVMSFLIQAVVRPSVLMKSIGWAVRSSKARSAAMSPMAGESLKPCPEKLTSRMMTSDPGRGPTSGRVLPV